MIDRLITQSATRAKAEAAAALAPAARGEAADPDALERSLAELRGAVQASRRINAGESLRAQQVAAGLFAEGQVHAGRLALLKANADLVVAQQLRAAGHPYERDASPRCSGLRIRPRGRYCQAPGSQRRTARASFYPALTSALPSLPRALGTALRRTP